MARRKSTASGPGGHRRRTRVPQLTSSLSLDKAIIVLRKGNAIDQARILNKQFVIDIEELGEIKVKTTLIKSIILKNEPTFPLDVIRMLKGNEMSGTVLTDPVQADSEEVGGRIDIPLSKILAVVF